MNNKRILVVDDDANILEIYRRVLEGEESSLLDSLRSFAGENPASRGDRDRFDVVQAGDGEAGVVEVERARADQRPFAAAFVDIRMPPGIDGLEAARRMRAIDDRLRIVIITAYSDHPVDELQAVLRHDVLLARKPLTGEEILQLARNACVSWEREGEMLAEMARQENKVRDVEDTYGPFLGIVRAMSDGVLLCDFAGSVQGWNSRALQLLQYPYAALLNESLERLVGGVDVMELIRSSLTEMEMVNFAAELITFDGEHLPVILNLVILHSERKVALLIKPLFGAEEERW